MRVWILAFLVALALADGIPSRQYTEFSIITNATVPLIDSGFRMGNAIFWSSPDAGSRGPGSLIITDLQTNRMASFSKSTIDFLPTQKFIQGFANPANSRQSYMILNQGGQTIFKLFQSTFSYDTTTDVAPNCTEDNPPVCDGNITTVTTRLVVNHQTVGTTQVLLQGLALSGEIYFNQARAYITSVGVNFTVSVINTATLTLVRQIQVTGTGSTTGFPTKTQLSDDGSILYILTNTRRFYRIIGVNTTAPRTELIMTFAANEAPLAFIVSDSWEEALFTTSGFPASILWVDLEQRRVYERSQLTTLFAPQVVLKDGPAGFAYVVGFNRPSLIMRVNLLTHDQDPAYNPLDSGRASNGFIDIETATMFLASSSQAMGLIYPGACDGNCSNRGDCGIGGICLCDAGYQGDKCENLECPKGVDEQTCSANGICTPNGTCACFPGYVGNVCQNYTCPDGCGGNGVCDPLSHLCKCNPGWTDVDCGTSLIKQCQGAKTCSACSRKTLCVWCESNQTCILGDIEGPLIDFCRDWHYRTCNWMPFRVVGILFMVVCFIFMLINFVLMVLDDRLGEEVIYDQANTIRSLWSSQRDLQTWIMIEQVQLGALLAYYAVPVPSNLKGFVEAIGPMLLISRPPWQSEELPVINGRNTQSLIQTANTKGTHPLDLMAGSFFIFLLLCGVALVYGVIALVLPNKMAKWRATHFFLRIIQFCHPGLVALGAYTVTQTGTDFAGTRTPTFSLVAAYLSVILLGVGYPLAIAAFVVFNKKNLFTPSIRTQFGSWYDTYHHSKLWYGAVGTFKLSAIALFVGFFADTTTGRHAPIMSMLMPIFIIIIYIVTTILARPFVDKIRGIVQVMMLGFLNILMFGITIVYLNFEPFDGWAVAVAALVGGAIFFTVLMWIMNALRVGKVNQPKGVDGGNDYVRM